MDTTSIPVDGGAVLLLGAKGLVLLTLAALGAGLLRGAPAAARHGVWFLATAGLLALPVAHALTPGWTVAVPAALATRVQEAVRIANDGAAHAGGVGEGAGTAAVPASPAAATDVLLAGDGAAAEGRSLPTWAALLAGVWAVGAAGLLFALGAGFWGLTRTARHLGCFGPGPVLDAAAGVQRELRIVTPVLLRKGPAGAMPMSWGILRPVVLLPADAERWPAERLRVVLLHELAHVRRRDCLSQTVAEVARALHWPNPLAWVAVRRLRIEREHACDDLVVLAGARPSAYAAALVDLARGRPTLAARGAAAMATTRPSRLAERLRRILDDRRPRRWSTAAARATGVAALGVVFGLAALTPTLRGAESHEVSPLVLASPPVDLVPVDPPAPPVVSSRLTGADVGATPGGVRDRTAADPRPAPDPEPVRLATVRGRVTNVGTGAPIPGARIHLVGSTLTAIASESGGFRLDDVPAGTHELLVEADGYGPLRRTVALSEGAVLETDFALEGASPVVVSGTAGAARARVPGEITIRGPNDASTPPPIVFIDGVRIQGGVGTQPGAAGGIPVPPDASPEVARALAALPPNEIERIEVVRGPAAAGLYEPEAAGGVILVFTKKP